MKKSTKAALYSGLIFPGLGHMILKQYLRGSVLILASLIALSVIVKVAVGRALAIVDSIESGEATIGTGGITELAANSMSGADNSTANYALIFLGACWLIGIIDSYRVGKTQENQ